jgi:hypothetical protein
MKKKKNYKKIAFFFPIFWGGIVPAFVFFVAFYVCTYVCVQAYLILHISSMLIIKQMNR